MSIETLPGDVRLDHPSETGHSHSMDVRAPPPTRRLHGTPPRDVSADVVKPRTYIVRGLFFCIAERRTKAQGSKYRLLILLLLIGRTGRRPRERSVDAPPRGDARRRRNGTFWRPVLLIGRTGCRPSSSTRRRGRILANGQFSCLNAGLGADWFRRDSRRRRGERSLRRPSWRAARRLTSRPFFRGRNRRSLRSFLTAGGSSYCSRRCSSLFYRCAAEFSRSTLPLPLQNPGGPDIRLVPIQSLSHQRVL